MLAAAPAATVPRRYLRHGTLPQLAAFEAVVRLGSVTRAADALCMAQPTLSGHLRKLSESLDIQLFEQHGFAAFQARFARYDLLLNQPLRLSTGVEGIGRGVDATGALQVMTSEGLQAITSSEVSVRPVAG